MLLRKLKSAFYILETKGFVFWFPVLLPVSHLPFYSVALSHVPEWSLPRVGCILRSMTEKLAQRKLFC